MTRSARPLELLGRKANGPACPDPACGSTKTHRRISGWTVDDQFIRQRECYACGLRFPTVEVAAPGDFHSLDDHGRTKRRLWARAHENKTGTRRPHLIRPSDVLRVAVAVERRVLSSTDVTMTCTACGKTRTMKRHEWQALRYKDAYLCYGCSRHRSHKAVT